MHALDNGNGPSSIIHPLLYHSPQGLTHALPPVALRVLQRALRVSDLHSNIRVVTWSAMQYGLPVSPTSPILHASYLHSVPSDVSAFSIYEQKFICNYKQLVSLRPLSFPGFLCSSRLQ